MSNARNLGNITAGGAVGATTASVTTTVNNVIDAAPGALNTLNELAAAMGDDANFSTTVTNSIATKLPLAGGTMTGNLTLGDNVKIEIGSNSGGDLQIYHDGNSKIADVGGGKLELHSDGTGVFIQKGATEYMAKFETDGAVTLYHDNSPKLTTTSTGLGIGASNNTSYDSVAQTLLVANESGHAGITIRGGGTNPFNGIHFADGVSNNDEKRAGRILYQHEHNVLSLHTANSERIRINGSGNVGIGETSPANILHIKTSASGGPQIELDSTSGTANSAFINFDGTSLQLATQRDMVDGSKRDTAKSWGGINIVGVAAGSYINFQTSEGANNAVGTRMTITKEGDVGIGATNPGGSKLYLQDTHTTTVTNATTMISNTTLTINGNSSQGSDVIRMGPMGTAGRYFIDVSNSAGNAAYDLLLNPIMGGNVGIGTTSGGAKLHVSATSVPAANTTDTDELVRFTVDGNTHGRIDLHTTAKNSTRRSTVFRPSSGTAYGFGISAYNMGTLDLGRVDAGYTWNGTNGDGEYTGGITQQPRYTRKAHFGGQIIGNNTYYTIAENMNDTRFTIECFCGDASSRDYKKYAGYYTSTGYGVYGLNQLLHSNGSWNSGSFDMRVSAPNGNLSIDLRFSSYYSSSNIASWMCIYTAYV